ncbi:hypothetical protein HUJ04_010253 [Dendroctonus ponderosae]|nr:hypothetical protein HUJ04_010253 [Dendroctonus ponderosae]
MPVEEIRNISLESKWDYDASDELEVGLVGHVWVHVVSAVLTDLHGLQIGRAKLLMPVPVQFDSKKQYYGLENP